MKIYFFIIKALKYFLKIDFSFLKNEKILVYSALPSRELDQMIKYKYQVMNIPSMKLNIFILIKMILNLKLRKIDYLYFFIKKINPKILISTYDNDIHIFKLKKKFPSLKFILIQNGKRGGIYDIFNNEFKKPIKKKYFIDYFFVFGNAIKKEYQKFVSSKFYTIGSFRNNFFKIKNNVLNKKNIVFISQFRPKYSMNFKYKNKLINYENYYKNSTNLFQKLEKFCFENKIQLLILPSSTNNSSDWVKEKSFFNDISIVKKFKFLKKKTNIDSYKIINKYDIFFGEDSTLIYEALSKNKRIGSFSRLKNIDLYSFTWPLKNNNKGFFFSNNLNDYELRRIYRNITNINQKNWLKKIELYKKNFMSFDYNNLKIKNLIKKKINESN